MAPQFFQLTAFISITPFFSRINLNNSQNNIASISREGLALNNYWLYFLISFIIAGLLVFIRRREILRLKTENELRLANLQANNEKEMNQRKSRFYEHFSYELLGPLTLIKGPVEQIIESSSDIQLNRILQSVHSNASELLDVVNQIYELSCLKSDKYILKVFKGDFITFVRNLVFSYSSYAKEKNIRLSCEINSGLEQVLSNRDFFYNTDILQKVIIGLIKQGLNDSRPEGTVTCSISMDEKEEDYVNLTVHYGLTGLEENLKDLRSDKYEVSYSDIMEDKQGAFGIKFRYLEELVTLHKGTIEVKGIQGVGKNITIRLPLGATRYSADEIIQEILPAAEFPEMWEQFDYLKLQPDYMEFGELIKGKPCALVIDDQADIRRLIARSMQKDFRILLASDGTTGFSMANEYFPDVIISDIMMPVMSGVRLCEKIKTNESTSHIPLILLTAKSNVEDKLEGLKMGADDFLIKPFDAKELSVRALNLVEGRRILREKYSSQSSIVPGEILVAPQDKIFMEKILGLINTRIADASLSVEELSNNAGMSLSQLHRKLKAIVNMSGNQLIRKVRMDRAMELLQKNTGNISEISFSVGYEDPGYFSKSFYKYFGKLPSEIQSRNHLSVDL